MKRLCWLNHLMPCSPESNLPDHHRRSSAGSSVPRCHRSGQVSSPGTGWNLCFPFRLAVLAECHLNAAFVGAAQDVQLDGVVGRLERAGQVVDGAYWLAGGRQDQVAGCQASAAGWAALFYPVDEQALDVGEADGAPQPPGHMAGSDRDAKLWWRDRFPAGERVDSAAQRLAGGYGQVETFTKAVRVDPEQLSGRVKDRPARGAGQQGAVCSRLPVMRRPRGPRKVRSIPETVPNVTRSPRPPGLARAKTGMPMAGAAVAQGSAGT